MLRVAFHAGSKPFRDTIMELRKAYEGAGGITVEEIEYRKRLASRPAQG